MESLLRPWLYSRKIVRILLMLIEELAIRFGRRVDLPKVRLLLQPDFVDRWSTKRRTTWSICRGIGWSVYHRIKWSELTESPPNPGLAYSNRIEHTAVRKPAAGVNRSANYG